MNYAPTKLSNVQTECSIGTSLYISYFILGGVKIQLSAVVAQRIEQSRPKGKIGGSIPLDGADDIKKTCFQVHYPPHDREFSRPVFAFWSSTDLWSGNIHRDSL